MTKERQEVLDEFINDCNGCNCDNVLRHCPAKDREERAYLYEHLKKLFPRVSFLNDSEMPSI